MKRFRRIGLSLMLAVALLVVLVAPAAAANPTVTITVKAQVVSISNSKLDWDIGIVTLDATVYFSPDGNEDDDWSMITNIGSVAVDVEIQGTDFEGGDYDWTLAASAGNQTYSLKANWDEGATYNITVKKADHEDLCWDLDPDDTWDWSMLFTAPDEFHASDDGNAKNATVVLVASPA